MANPIRICSSHSLRPRTVTAAFMFFAVAMSAPARTTCGEATQEASTTHKRGTSLLQVDPGRGGNSLVEINEQEPVQESGPAPPAVLGDDLASIPVPSPEPPQQAESDDTLISTINDELSGNNNGIVSTINDELSGKNNSIISTMSDVLSGDASQPSDSGSTSNTESVNYTDAVVNETIVDLGSDNATQGVNVSELAPGPPPPAPELEPYSNISTSLEIVVEPIKDAKPLPTLAPENISGALLDCILLDWSEWTDCQTSKDGMKDTEQSRYRKVVQPWSEGGKPCGPSSEVQRCKVFSIASTLMNS
eukprot:TRINITY_DN15097_c0_g1_i1.p1 TRINITY_DN15097_c0_g1~~TRINITY_DN15097_c0_g1_i1.p1  ORF type:complete len:306 (+),score=51.53 TRINITY_DN15097_c0_g1_i1:68-985(+)